jgi:hypothetical protein
VIGILFLSLWICNEFYDSGLKKVPKELPSILLIVSLAMTAIFYSYNRYLIEETLINDNKEDLEQSSLTKVSSESLNELFSDIKDSQTNILNSLLTVNGLLAAIFLALIIIEAQNKLLAILAFSLFVIVYSIVFRNFIISLRVYSAMLYAIGLTEQQRQHDKFQEKVRRFGIRQRFNIGLAIFFVCLQAVFIFYLLVFEFSYN